MARLGSHKKVPKWKKPKKNAPVPDEALAQDLEKVSELSSQLFDMDPNAYDKTFEQLVLLLTEKELIPSDWVPGTPLEKVSSLPKTQLMFEYKWGQETQELYGPFTATEMHQWASQGFFDNKECWYRKVDAGTKLDTSSDFIVYDGSYLFT